MDVTIKSFEVEMALKNNGIELEVSDPHGDHRGDLILSKARLEWCEGRTRRGNGKPISWNDFIAYMNARP
ncbi:MAG: hypothetical protein ACRD2E_11130 [Terriglobales bacterium]